VEYGNATGAQLFRVLGVEQHVPAAQVDVFAEYLAHTGRVVAQTVGAVAPRDQVFVTRIHAGDDFHDGRVEIFPVGDLGLVELLKKAPFNLTGGVVRGRHHDIEAGFAGEQPGLQGIVAVVHAVVHLDARGLL